MLMAAGPFHLEAIAEGFSSNPFGSSEVCRGG